MKSHAPETEEEFDRLLADLFGDALLVFTAEFCGPSKLLVETLTEFSLDRSDYPINLIWIDVEKLPTITRKYQVKGTPQMVMLRIGLPTSSRIGTMSFEQLSDWIDSELESA